MKNFGRVVSPSLMQPVRVPYFLEREKEAIIRREKKYSGSEVLARMILIFLVVLVAILSLSVWLYGFLLSQQLANLEKELVVVKRANDLELVRIAELENLDHLYQVATQTLGLTRPEKIE